MSISKLVMNLPLQWWKDGDDWYRLSRDMLISIEWHKNISVQQWHASSSMQILKSTVYEGCLISLWPKVEADVLYSCKLARVQIYSINENTKNLKLSLFLVFLLQIIRNSQLAVSNHLDLENGKADKIGHCAVFMARVVFKAHPAMF